MRLFEAIFLWSSIGAYLVSFLLFLSSIVFKAERHIAIGWKVAGLGFILHTLTILTRWIESGHLPVLWSFEHALAGAWFIMAVFLLLTIRYPVFKTIGVVVSPVALLTLGYGIMSHSTQTEPLPPPYQSNWLWVHVGFAWIAYGAYHVAAGLAALYLLKERAVRKRQESIHWFYKKLPEIETIDDIVFKLIVYGFISHIVMIGSGAIWAYGLWGRYWAWAPIETWTLVSWLIYGLNIHLRVTYDFTGSRGAWLAIISLLGVLMFFGGIGFREGVHTPLL
ncbi:MAG: cytochrome c biogenesis protein CcsA [Thermodesulfobacteriota bacterium]